MTALDLRAMVSSVAPCVRRLRIANVYDISSKVRCDHVNNSFDHYEKRAYLGDCAAKTPSFDEIPDSNATHLSLCRSMSSSCPKETQNSTWC